MKADAVLILTDGEATLVTEKDIKLVPMKKSKMYNKSQLKQFGD